MQRGRLEEALGRIIDFYKYYPQQMEIKTVNFPVVHDMVGEILYPHALSFYIASKAYLEEVIKSFKLRGALEIAKLINFISKRCENSDERLRDLIKISETVDKNYILEGFPEFTAIKLIENKPLEITKYKLKNFLGNKETNQKIKGYELLDKNIYPKYNSSGVLFIAGLVGNK